MNLENKKYLFVLSQNEAIMNAVKSSNIVTIFKNIIFIEEELYTNDLVKAVGQSVSYGSSIISVEKIKNFIEQMKTKDFLKDISEENYYIMTIENTLDIIGDEKKEPCELVCVQIYNKQNIYHSIGLPAKFPEKYVEKIKNTAKPILIENTQENNENNNKEIFLGFDKSIKSIILENEDSEDWKDEWVKQFNEFTKHEQYIYVINQLHYADILKNNTNNLYEILSEPLYKNMLKISILQKLNKIKNLNIDYVVGIESSGFCVGILIADMLNIPFVPIRRSGYLTGEVYSTIVDKGNMLDNIEISKSSIKNKSNILIVDDIINTGNTINSASTLIKNFEPQSVNLFIIRQTSSTITSTKFTELYENLHILIN
jgi:adenine phosphoribosyltransferase